MTSKTIHRLLVSGVTSTSEVSIVLQFGVAYLEDTGRTDGPGATLNGSPRGVGRVT